MLILEATVLFLKICFDKDRGKKYTIPMKKVCEKPMIFMVLLLLFPLLTGIGCASVPTSSSGNTTETEPIAKVEEPKEELPEEPSEQPKEEPQVDVDKEEPKEEPEEDPAEEPEEEFEPEGEEEPQQDSSDKDNYIATEKEYEETFSNIGALIQELNQIIKSKDYDKWLTYLSEDYREYLSDPKTLKEISEEPVLKKYDITLRSLKDYFNYVVVPSRSNARLDDLTFVDKNHVKAIMIINKKRIILYELKKINEKWKIGNW